MHAIWFPTWYRQIASEYEDNLAEKVVPWIESPFDMSSVIIGTQQDGAPMHTSVRVERFWQKLNFYFRLEDMWPSISPVVSSLDYAFWSHIEANACNPLHSNITLKISDNQKWMAMKTDYVFPSCKGSTRGLEGIIISDGRYQEWTATIDPCS